jgi:hypothetical protein
MSNADCVAVGATICGGKRCTSDGSPCTTAADCGVGHYCVHEGEASRPDACGGSDGEPPEGCQASGFCADGPFQQYCAEPEAYRFCSTTYAAETCPLTSSCENFEYRRCFYDDGTGVTVAGAAAPPMGGVSSAAIGGLLCSGVRPPGGSVTNIIFGFPGLVRIRSEGTLTFGDGTLPPAQTPQPTTTSTPLPTPVPGGCPLTASASCRGTASGDAKLEIRRANDPFKRILKWQWRKGASTLPADFGNPTTSDAYELCIYHQGELAAWTPIAPGGTCQGKPCWRSSPSKITFRNRDTATRAATRVDLKHGVAGKSAIAFAAAGPHLFPPDLGTLVGPVEVQLQSFGTGVCWGATFAPPFDQLDVEKGTLKTKN